MEILAEDVGKIVAIQLARPLYMMQYAAHVTVETGDPAQAVLAPMIESTKVDGVDIERVMVRDLLTSVKIVKNNGDSVVLELMVPSRTSGKVHLIHKHIRSSDIVAYDVMLPAGFNQDPPHAEERDVGKSSIVLK